MDTTAQPGLSSDKRSLEIVYPDKIGEHQDRITALLMNHESDWSYYDTLGSMIETLDVILCFNKGQIYAGLGLREWRSGNKSMVAVWVYGDEIEKNVDWIVKAIELVGQTLGAGRIEMLGCARGERMTRRSGLRRLHRTLYKDI